MMNPIRDRAGLTKSLVFYLILILIILLSMYFAGAALIAYILIIAILYILKKRDGFKWGISWRFGFLFGFILIASIFVLELGFGWIKFEKLSPDALNILIGAIIFELLVAVGEEISFRGYILPNLMDSLGIRNAVIITSILFAGLHIPSILSLGIEPFNALIMFTTIGIAGILLALLYLLDGLKMSAGFHFSWNFFQYHIFSLRSGFGIFGLVVTRPEFTGGQAGPEAGLTGLSMLLLGTLVLWVLFPSLRKE